MNRFDLKTLLVGDVYLKCHLFLKVGILNNLKYYFNRARHFYGEMKRKGERERVLGSLAAGEDWRRGRARGVNK